MLPAEGCASSLRDKKTIIHCAKGRVKDRGIASHCCFDICGKWRGQDSARKGVGRLPPGSVDGEERKEAAEVKVV